MAIPSDVAVRPKNLPLYNIGEPDRQQFQVVRTRKGATSKGSMNKESFLKSEQRNPSGASGPPSAAALQIEGADDDLLYVIVGVLLPEETVNDAENLAEDRESKLETIDGFNMAAHGSSIAPKSTNPIKVVLPIWPNGWANEGDAQKKQKTLYHILCNMQDGLCEAHHIPDGVRNPNFFFYPEWTRSGTAITQYRHRVDEWTAYVRRWRVAYREGPKEGPQAPGSAADNLPNGLEARATPNLLPDHNEIPGIPVSQKGSLVQDICQAMALTDDAPKDAAWVNQIKDLLNPATGVEAYKPAPEFRTLGMVMEGNREADLGIAKYAIMEFNTAFPVSDGDEARKMSPEALVQLARGIRLMKQEQRGYMVE